MLLLLLLLPPRPAPEPNDCLRRQRVAELVERDDGSGRGLVADGGEGRDTSGVDGLDGADEVELGV